MSSKFPITLAVAAFALALLAQQAAAQTLVREGAEFQVPVYTQGTQAAPSAATKGLGFVLVWSSFGQDGSSDGIFGRRYNASGFPQGGEFQINVYTSGNQQSPSVAADSEGDFVVVWQSFGQDGSDQGIFGRRFDLAGTPVGGEFQVNSFTVGYQGLTNVAADGDGDFVVTWTSYQQDIFYGGAFGRFFASSGVPQGVEFQISSFTTGYEYAYPAAFQSDGDFVILWTSSDGDYTDLFARRYDSAGGPQGAQFQVNTTTGYSQDNADLAVGNNDDFVVAWVRSGPSTRDMLGRRFDAGANPVGVEFKINSQTTGGEDTSIAVDGDGDFVVAWRSGSIDGSGIGVSARLVDSSGTPQGVEVQVNSYATGDQYQPDVAGFGADHFVVVWRSYGQDGNQAGVFAQKLAVAALAVLDVDGDGEVTPLTDGLLVVRWRFGFTGATLISGVVDGDCTRCDGPDIVSYLDGLALTLDIDGDGEVAALADGLLALRFLFGFTGTTLTSGVVDTSDCTRCDAAAILPYLQTLD